jgi:FAD/FMN-containing dehydrogenase
MTEVASDKSNSGEPGPAVSLRHEALIAASAERVWEALVDVRAWPEWNPTLRDADGPLEVGQWVRMGLQLGPVRISVQQHVQALDAPRLLAWRTRNVSDGFMDVDRTFEIVPLAGGGVLLRQGETALGPVAPIAMPLLRRWILRGYDDLARALKSRVEDGSVRLDLMDPLTEEDHVNGSDEHGQPSWRARINQHETFDHDSIDSLFYDWDRIGDPDGPARSPLKFYVPRSTEDVVRCVLECRELGQVLFVRSKGHSSNDLVTPVGGAVLLTEKLHGVIEVDTRAMTATVWAGTPSAQVDAHLTHLGLGLPVIGDHADITVGGFTSVGGITASSFRFGLFVDVVQRLEYVDWTGAVHIVDRSDGVDEFNRLLMGLGRHGVITKVTVSIISIHKDSTYWRNDATRHRDLDAFVAESRELCANPPTDARFLRGVWVDFPMPGDRNLQFGTMSVYRDTDMNAVRRASEAASYGGLHRLGWMAGRLPEGADKAVKMAGMAGVLVGPKYATVRNAEFFTEKILDATVGDPQRFLVVISPIEIYEEQFHRLLQMVIDYREAHGCFTFISLYVKSINSPYLAQGDPDNQRWVEFLFYVGVNPDLMTDALLDGIADDLDQNCIDTGSYRYMHTRTGRAPERLGAIDPNAPYNGGVSRHPADRPFA